MAAGSNPAAVARVAAEIDLLGATELLGASAVTADVLARGVPVVTALTGRGGAATNALRALRTLVADLEPGRFGVGDPSGRGAQRYAAQVEAAEEEMGRGLGVLRDGRDALRQENAVIGQQERALWLQMHNLRRYARLAQRLDEELTARIGDPGAAGSPDPARQRSTDVLLGVRGRRRDLLMHLAVAAQGYAALRMIERTNEELIRTIDGAIASTTAAVRSATLAVRAMTSARQLGETVTSEGVREAMATAARALEAVNRSKSDVLETMQSTLRAIRDDASTSGGAPPAV
jgi:Toxic anion resistance protein (TelA)